MTTTTNYEPCDQCSAPLDADQRYCVACGANRRHPNDPVARYLAGVRKPATTPAAPPPSRRGDGRALLAAIALLPVAAAAGVLVGKSGNKADPNLVAALKAQQAALAKAGPATAATSQTVASTALSSDFSRKKGFVVELKTLPFKTTTEAGAKSAESDAKSQGAKAVGIINPDDFKLKPSPGGDYILYSGEFSTSGAAQKALRKLHKAFPGAKVVTVSPLSSGASGGGATSASAGSVGQVDKTIANKHPSQKEKVEGAKVVQQIESKTGQDYVHQQQKLPQSIVVP